MPVAIISFLLFLVTAVTVPLHVLVSSNPFHFPEGPLLRCGIVRIDAGLETLPPFTLRLSSAFVNGKQRISTGFLWVLPVFH
jgi:hypothetical protein